MKSVLSVSYESIALFLEAAQGNYRNAIYVACNCTYEKESGCGDFLFIPGFDCRPILIPLADLELFMGTQIDKSDCAGILTSGKFFRLYHKWLELSLTSSTICPFHQLLSLMNAPYSGK